MTLDALSLLGRQSADPAFHLALDASIDPGDQATLVKRPGVTLHLTWLVADAVAHGPELRFFQRGIWGTCAPARGSRRRGRRAAILWASAVLVHAKDHPLPIATIDSVQILKREHVLTPIPIALMRDGGPVEALVPKDADVRVLVSNHETHRKVRVGMRLSGKRMLEDA